MSQMDAKKLATVAATTVVAGAAAYGVYYVVKKRSSGAQEKPAVVAITASIEKKHIAFLEEKAQEYCNSDSDAALKVLLDYARDGDEKLIFETVRCNTCGGKKDKEDYTASIDGSHAAYLEEMAGKHNLKDGTSKALRVIIEFAMQDGDVADIYTAARCAKWGSEASS